MTPRTEEEALDQCKLLWEELARNGMGIEDKYEVAERLLGYRPMHACPACEWDDAAFVGFICAACPIKAWRRASPPDVPNKCCADNSPHHLWRVSRSASSRKEYAQQVLKLIEDSRDA